MQLRYGIKVVYRNYRGEVATRTLSPEYVWYGTTDWHPKEGYLLHAYDHEKQAYRDFALADCDFVGANHEPTASHADDLAVDRFASAMKAKLAKKCADGRGGWDGDTCTSEILSALLREHVEKGDPLDVGNLAMMLHQRGERVAPTSAGPVAWRYRYASAGMWATPEYNRRTPYGRIGCDEQALYAHPAPVTVEAATQVLLKWCDDRQSEVVNCLDLRADEEASAVLWIENFRNAIRALSGEKS